ncbi:MAG: hypothetical protein AAB600_03330 [Patescibacteria group bacterium]
MITIIHGEDIVNSRKFFIDERKRSSYPITFLSDNLNLTDLTQTLEGGSLFDIKDKEIFIEDFFSKKRSQEFDSIISYLQKHGKNVNIKIWESREVSKKQLNNLKNTTIKLFSLPKPLFLFLNKLAPHNSKRLIYLFHKTLESIEAELVFYMMIRQFRLLLAIFGESQNNQIDEIKNIQPWQKARLKKQVSFFSETHLKNIYNKICTIEISQKTGSSILSLPQAIDFLLLSI